MKKKIPREDLLRKISSTAYCFKELGYYGSRDKAIKALLKRKGFEGYSTKTIASEFGQALKIITDTREFIELEITQKTPLTHRKEEVNLVVDKLGKTLVKKNPRAPKEMIQYALNWVYMNYYLR